jgi:hypothetical protein
MKQFTSTQVKNMQSHSLSIPSAIKCHNKILKLHETVHCDAGKKYVKCN